MAATGCVHWTTTVEAEVRSGVVAAEVTGKPSIFFGNSSGYLHGLDGATGKQLWKLRLQRIADFVLRAIRIAQGGRHAPLLRDIASSVVFYRGRGDGNANRSAPHQQSNGKADGKPYRAER